LFKFVQDKKNKIPLWFRILFHRFRSSHQIKKNADPSERSEPNAHYQQHPSEPEASDKRTDPSQKRADANHNQTEAVHKRTKAH
jgi:hypothetical protein